MSTISADKPKPRSPQTPGQSTAQDGPTPRPTKPKSRSRSGCVTCKEKHLKCDETKPFCQMCQSKGSKCGGYQQQLRWSYKYETAVRKRRKDTKPAKPTKTTQNQKPIPLSSHPVAIRPRSPAQNGPLQPKQDLAIHDTVPEPEWQAALASLRALEDNYDGSDDNLYCFGDDATDVTVLDDDIPDLIAADTDVSSQLEIIPVSRSHDYSGNLIRDNTAGGWAHMNQQPAGTTGAVIFPSLIDTPSILITHWFERVCAVWSGYDSHLNLNRSLALNLWQQSETVSNCLQSMSAALMTATSPEMKQTSLRLLKDATSTVNRELSVIHSTPQLENIPVSLLFSLLCLGTSVCWTEATYLGVPFLREARALMNRINARGLPLSAENKQILSYFDKSLVYCDMLLAMVGYGDIPQDEKVEDEGTPHPWTGISTASYRLFARAVTLCQTFRRGSQQPRTTTEFLQNALKQIEEAQSIEEQVLAMETPAETDLGETGDQRTPRAHLVSLAEAYRLASLVHLYQTFPDLAARRLPRDSWPARNAQASLDTWIVALSLRLIETLKDIPPNSGSRMMQPALYISASTGLKLNLPTLNSEDSLVQFRSEPSPHGRTSLDHEDCEISEYMSHLCGFGSENTYSSENLLMHSAFGVEEARNFVLERLDIFEYTLPPNPIIVAKELVKAIWAAYDADVSGQYPIHWIDIMQSRNLRSLFG
ncbi:unnamed protein product [Clonostachys byssicola]|uniref:Zn(2)-C6 fungal-type domain-containing protein n=1 Tax=Clonostachys byssicola TaxID=160290 RepID=A0A9N9U444_9HYPO|nr:unnamed protein product [Clonostachys byssicola]